MASSFHKRKHKCYVNPGYSVEILEAQSLKKQNEPGVFGKTIGRITFVYTCFQLIERRQA